MTMTSKETDLQAQVIELQQRLGAMENVLSSAKDVLTLEEAAVFMGVTKSTLYRMTHEQTIPYFKPGGKMCYFEKSELLNWMKSNRIASMTENDAEARLRLQMLAKK